MKLNVHKLLTGSNISLIWPLIFLWHLFVILSWIWEIREVIWARGISNRLSLQWRPAPILRVPLWLYRAEQVCFWIMPSTYIHGEWESIMISDTNMIYGVQITLILFTWKRYFVSSFGCSKADVWRSSQWEYWQLCLSLYVLLWWCRRQNCPNQHQIFWSPPSVTSLSNTVTSNLVTWTEPEDSFTDIYLLNSSEFRVKVIDIKLCYPASDINTKFSGGMVSLSMHWRW